jgi:hypothetical protein
MEELMRHVWAGAVAALLVAGPSAAAAQATCTGNPCSVQVTASATVNDVLRLTLSGASTSLGTPSETDYDAGYKDVAGPTASVKSNRPWHVDIAGAAATFSYTGALTNPNKPATDLQWGTSAGTYGNNMGSAAVLLNGATGTGSASQAIFFRTLWSWATDVPGSYSLIINFTLAAP